MVQPLINNTLYTYLRGAISNALPLEYSIRASESLSPDSTDRLREINSKIKLLWNQIGASDEEIAYERLLDYAWDLLQVGFPLLRRHDREIHPSMVQLIEKGLDDIPRRFQREVDDVVLPAGRFFRICDLLNGADIAVLLNEVDRCLKHAQKFGASDEIELRDFRGIHIRQPVYIWPQMTYVQSRHDKGLEDFGLLIDLRAEFSAEEFNRMIQEFIYQYAVYRAMVKSGHDELSNTLIQGFLENNLRGECTENRVERMNSFSSVLSGLYCWDKHKRQGMKIGMAVEETIEVCPRSEVAIRKNFKIADAEIEKARERFSVNCAFKVGEFRAR